MALNISIFWLGWPIFLVALVVVVALIIVLTVVERRIHKRVALKKQSEETYYQRKLGAIKTLKKEKEILSSLDEVAKEYFEEKYRPAQIENGAEKDKNLKKELVKKEIVMNKNASYSDLVDFFKEKKDVRAAEFSNAMVKVLYSGEKLSKVKLDGLYNMLEKIIGEAVVVQDVKVDKTPVRSEATHPDLKAPIKPMKNYDEHTEGKIKKVLEDRRPIEPAVKAAIAAPANQATTVEILGPAKETRVGPSISAQSGSIKRRGFFSKLFGPKTQPVVKKTMAGPVVREDKNQPSKIKAPIKKIPANVNMNLVKYISEGTKRGFEVVLLKKKLITAGFKAKDVESAIHYISAKKAEKMGPAIKSNLVDEKPIVKNVDEAKDENKEIKRAVAGNLPRDEAINLEPAKKKHKSILARFFHSKNTDLIKIKKEVESGGKMEISSGKQDVNLIAPRKSERKHGNIENMDDLDRVKKKIESRQQILARKGYRGAELAKLD